MKRFALVMVIALSIFAFTSNFCLAERKVISGFPYINQVEDMDKTKFLGYNACGPTTSVMLVQYHKVQSIPEPFLPRGWYVYNHYSGFTDKSGNNYSTKYAMDWDGVSSHIHNVNGAHGSIVYYDEYADKWWANIGRITQYIKNHGLEVGNLIYSDRHEIIKNNIDAGLPVIGHSYINGNGHYLPIVGYDTGVNGDEQNVVVNDPSGNANIDWLDTQTGGEQVTYPLLRDSGSSSTIDIDYVVELHPIGIYNWFPGWRADIFPQSSQPFVDAYNLYGGRDRFGIPWSNGPGGPWVHAWPDGESSENTVYLQDYVDTNDNNHWWQLALNMDSGEVFPVHGQILTFWHNNYGYYNYGPPSTTEYNKRNTNGNLIIVQEFEKTSTTHYLGYDTVLGQTREYNFWELYDYDQTDIDDDPDFVIVGSKDDPDYIPTNLVASAISDSQIYLAWTGFDSPDDYSNFEYRVYNSSGSYIGDSDVPNFSNMNLSSSTEYCYEVVAVFDGTETEVSNEICATTLSSAPSVVVYPAGNFSLTKTGDYEVRLSWDFNENEDAPTLYSLVYSFADGEFLDILNTGRNFAIYDELEIGVQYCFYVRMELEGIESVATLTKCITLSDPTQTVIALPSPALRIE
ncbi:MAG: hypothetical protein PF572_04800 [Patescibacteria group bacterium]|jgi:hypothetical protein|nr:hypothetical protein [Patescibacteria group bacterium]